MRIVLLFLLLPFVSYSQWNKCTTVDDSCKDDTRLVYYYELNEGVDEYIWSGDDAVDHDDPGNIFNGVPSSLSYGTPSHPNAPTVSSVTTWNKNTTNDPSNGVDQALCVGYFYAPQDGTIIGDQNNNNGERFRVWLGDCCSSPKVFYESPSGDDSPFTGGSGNAIGNFATVDEGWHLLIVEIADRAAFAGFDLTLNDERYTGLTSRTKPKLVCKRVDCEYVLAENEFDCTLVLVNQAR